MKKNITLFGIMLFTIFSFTGQVDRKEDNIEVRDCNLYASKMIATIEKHIGCLETDDYNQVYSLFLFFCKLFDE